MATSEKLINVYFHSIFDPNEMPEVMVVEMEVSKPNFKTVTDPNELPEICRNRYYNLFDLEWEDLTIVHYAYSEEESKEGVLFFIDALQDEDNELYDGDEQEEDLLPEMVFQVYQILTQISDKEFAREAWEDLNYNIKGCSLVHPQGFEPEYPKL